MPTIPICNFTVVHREGYRSALLLARQKEQVAFWLRSLHRTPTLQTLRVCGRYFKPSPEDQTKSPLAAGFLFGTA